MPDQEYIYIILYDILMLNHCFFLSFHTIDGPLNRRICQILVSGNIQLFLILSGTREPCPGQLMKMEHGTWYMI